MARSWAHRTGDDSMLAAAKFSLSPEDIIKMSCYSCSQTVIPSLTAIHTVSSAGKTKTLPTFPQAGWRKSISILYLLTPVLSKIPSGRCPIGARDSPRLNAQPWVCRVWRVAFATDIAGQLVADMFKQVFIERVRRIAQAIGYRKKYFLCGRDYFESYYLDIRMLCPRRRRLPPVFRRLFVPCGEPATVESGIKAGARGGS